VPSGLGRQDWAVKTGTGRPAEAARTREQREPESKEHAVTSAIPPSPLDPAIAARLKRDAAGLFPAIAQQYDTGEVLMLAWMDDEALHRTLTTGLGTYWSRGRQEYWVKGATSGHEQRVKSVALDCDGDTVLVRVDQVGAACHTGDRTCFDAGPLPVTRPAAGSQASTSRASPSKASPSKTSPGS
jgi:phosphoribosyl-AMP cyclohydrolase